MAGESRAGWGRRPREDDDAPHPSKGSVGALSATTNNEVETTGAKEMTNPVRFGQDFIGRVANPRDILQYYRKKQTAERSE